MTTKPTPDQSSIRELRGLTGIRCIAAFWVFAYHVRTELANVSPGVAAVTEALTRFGYLGVDLFFTLSGFILAYNYHNQFLKLNLRSYVKFLVLRLARIYPVHIFILLLYVCAVASANFLGIRLTTPDFFTLGDFVRNVFLIQAWSFPVRASWNTLAWSVSCEWLAYIFLPILLIPFRRLNRPLLLGFYLIFSATVIQLPENFDFSGTYSFGIVRIATEFNMGIIMFYLFRSGFGKSINWNFGILFILSLILTISFTDHGGSLPIFALAPLFGFMILGIAYENSFHSKFLSLKPLVIGGYISYSFYMIHELILLVSRKLLPFATPTHHPMLNFSWIAITFFATLASAYLIHHFIEERYRLVIRNLVFSRK